tara:strand:- start:4584 stop:5897 length:1314 start_codon:yes stop_codon:yes gene_type:complete
MVKKTKQVSMKNKLCKSVKTTLKKNNSRGGNLHTKIAKCSARTFSYYKKNGGYFPPFTKTKKQKIRDRLQKSLKNTDNTVEFDLGNDVYAYGIKRINNLGKDLPEQKELTYITEGAYNSIFITRDKQLAYRINKDPVDSESDEATELITEALLTIDLAKLGITPKVIDCYFVKNGKENGENTHLVSISEYSKNGSLTKFLESEECTIDMIPGLVEKSINLYSKMIENKIFCVDVKTNNMLVTNNLELYLIDFEDYFCSKFKHMILNGKRIYTKTKRFIQKYLSVEKSQSEKITNRGFFCLNILQVGVVCVRNGGFILDENNPLILYARGLVKNIIAKDLQSMVVCATIEVSTNHTALDSLRYYLVNDDTNANSYQFEDYDISNDPTTIILVSYIWVMYNKDKATEYLNYLLNTSKTANLNLLEVNTEIAQIEQIFVD